MEMYAPCAFGLHPRILSGRSETKAENFNLVFRFMLFGDTKSTIRLANGERAFLRTSLCPNGKSRLVAGLAFEL